MLVVDVDGGRLLHCYGDEQRIIPRKLHKALISSIKDDAGDVLLFVVVVVMWPITDISAFVDGVPLATAL